MGRLLNLRRNDWTARLRESGFTPLGAERLFGRDGVVLSLEQGWLTLTTSNGSVGTDPLLGHLGRPGLWKPVLERGSLRLVSDVRASILSEDAKAAEAGGEGANGAGDSVLSWLLTTLSGRLPEGWEPPPREEVELQVDLSLLVVRSGAFTSQGTLIHGPRRLALEFPVCRIPDDLPAARVRWLRALLLDGQSRWRLARVGFNPAGDAAAAEVDLSGAPLSAIQFLVRTALESLRWVVGSILAPAALAVDPTVDSHILKAFPDETASPDETLEKERKV